jgi:hypothetical protein
MFLARRHKPPKLWQKIMPPIDIGTGQACPNEIGPSFNRKERKDHKEFPVFSSLRSLRSLRLIPFAVEFWASQSSALRNPCSSVSIRG